DPPNGLAGRRMREAVHLADLRCSGDAHGGCQAGCLLFWKNAWLDRVDGGGAITTRQAGCTEADVWAGTRAVTDSDPDNPTYVCQSTQVAAATEPLAWWDFRQYLEDYPSGNVGLSEIGGAFSFFLCEKVATAGLGLGAAVRFLYDFVQ